MVHTRMKLSLRFSVLMEETTPTEARKNIFEDVLGFDQNDLAGVYYLNVSGPDYNTSDMFCRLKLLCSVPRYLGMYLD